MRGSWTNPDAIYIGIKGGTAKASHAHMDVGSFVLDAHGMRWAMDFGGDDYNAWLLGLWLNPPDWRYYRLGSLSHNTLSIGGALQRAKGKARFIHFESTPQAGCAVLDMSDQYKGQADRVLRGTALLERKAVLMQDEITNPIDKVRWAMVTPADIELQGNVAILKQKNKKLRVEILRPADARFEIISTKPSTNWEKNNKGTTRCWLSLPMRKKRRSL